ncbi:hypothetical protein [Micromonospora sp. NBC_01813]|uniref:hypothetical protein n=1 Tax=Micromonospora sp. NBC_01813 TaxID=2975988 RepID=UPI002DD7F3DB|nr:hypothetical protein [Micromonospora sp. NBC_01813]WSA06891.1 hypothetical protein OG958_21810 [Micromonospora sp. NBC_01813]
MASASSPDELPSTEIVSRIQHTPAGAPAWVERDGRGRLFVRCQGCTLYREVPGLAPALAALVNHLPTCPGTADPTDVDSA